MNNIISCLPTALSHKICSFIFPRGNDDSFLSNFTQKQQIVYLPGIKYLCVTDSVINK